MSNSSLGFSFIESTEKIKGKLKQKTKEVKRKAPMLLKHLWLLLLKNLMCIMK